MKLAVTYQEDAYVVLSADHGGKRWDVEVHADDTGLSADIIRDGVLCTGAEFGWNDRHANEPQDNAAQKPLDNSADSLKLGLSSSCGSDGATRR